MTRDRCEDWSYCEKEESGKNRIKSKSGSKVVRKLHRILQTR
jgi:hypothetical protein